MNLGYVPFLAGLGLTLLLRAKTRRGARWAVLVGVGLEACFVLVASLFGALNNAPDPDSGITGLELVGLIVGGTLGTWLLGVGAAVALSAGLSARRRRRSVDA
jgi:hypothetical protein